MSSTNEELHPPPKPRISPLDFRNTDLVSRLLAATPPYLYNMPMVPNTYFFSEMLRSFVQAKADPNRGSNQNQIHHRRPRKRSWTQSRSEYYQKDSPNLEKPEVPSPNWKSTPEKTVYYDNKRTEIPLELTMEKPQLNKSPNDIDYHKLPPPIIDKPVIPNPHMPMLFPNIPQNLNPEQNQNLILPPPPPMWYPPLYQTPYGIDPLHFFIDLRVSGHIYDRKNGKESPVSSNPPSSTVSQSLDVLSASPNPIREGFKQSRHASAFSVPTPSSSRNTPMNLSSHKEEHKEKLKFDVKSMGWEKTSNKTSTNYVMSNVGRIYRELNEETKMIYKEEPAEIIKCDDNLDTKDEEAREETEEEKQKRVKDLRALIGLELVVDYMNHAKPGQQPQTSDESTSDNESAASSAVEVVTVHEELSEKI